MDFVSKLWTLAGVACFVIAAALVAIEEMKATHRRYKANKRRTSSTF